MLASAKEVYKCNKDKWCSLRNNIAVTECTICSHRCKFLSGCIMKKTEIPVITAPQLSTTEAEAEQHTEQDENTSRLRSSASSKTTCDFHFQKHPSISLPFEEDMETDTSCSYPSYTIDTSTLQTATTSFGSFNVNTDSTYLPSLVPVAESTPTKSRQTKDSSTSPMLEKEITFSWSLSLSPDTPLSKEEEQLLTQLVRRKLILTQIHKE
ncbi:hypothetical protein ElyMa_006693600 [Elysia marginata]|uniref:Uncharacterized protein n=1 Tax=Elysia marginata TaxID=1093978 RepID=A0AAV4IS95_9GAST|nr:hypothetical protein ElyMa_006693600 [Elysia marginata]